MHDRTLGAARISVTVEESDDYPEALTYTVADGWQRIYAAPDLNRTPAQSLGILKLHAAYGDAVEFVDDLEQTRARILFNGGDATLWYCGPDGEVVWKTVITPEIAVPDAPGAVPRTSPMYRWLWLAFGLFLLVITSFVWLGFLRRPYVLEIVGTAFALAVVAGIVVLRVVHSRMGL